MSEWIQDVEEDANVPIKVIPTPTMFTGVTVSPNTHAERDIVVTSYIQKRKARELIVCS